MLTIEPEDWLAGFSIIYDVLSNFDIQTFDFENNALFPNEAEMMLFIMFQSFCCVTN